MENCELLFKYYKWDDYCKESLELRYFWFSKPKNFNDPFDCNMDILKSFKRSSEIFETSFDGSMTFFDLIKRNTDNFGILCFTQETEVGKTGDKGYNNLHFWSHYANCHKGIVIGFDKDLLADFYSDKLECKVSLAQIKYFNNPVDLDKHDFIISQDGNGTITQRIDGIFGAYRDGKNIDRFFEQLLLFKDGRIWSNENEYRIILAGLALENLKENNPFTDATFNVSDEKNEGYKLPYPPGNIIREVTLGVNFKNEEMDEAISIISRNNNEVRFYKAKLDFANADINRREIN